MPDDVRLYELVTFFGIEPTGYVLGYAIKDVLAKGCGVCGGRDRVQVDDAKVAFVVFEHGRPITYGPEVIAQGEFASGLGTGKDDLFCFLFRNSHKAV
jgi:hypothetical protein